eukprot:4206135-Pyramimonas_sp.AAC.1
MKAGPFFPIPRLARGARAARKKRGAFSQIRYASAQTAACLEQPLAASGRQEFPSPTVVCRSDTMSPVLE